MSDRMIYETARIVVMIIIVIATIWILKSPKKK